MAHCFASPPPPSRSGPPSSGWCSRTRRGMCPARPPPAGEQGRRRSSSGGVGRGCVNGVSSHPAALSRRPCTSASGSTQGRCERRLFTPRCCEQAPVHLGVWLNPRSLPNEPLYERFVAAWQRALEAEYLPISPHIAGPRSGRRCPASQLALERARIPLYSAAFRCMHCPPLRCTHAVL